MIQVPYFFCPGTDSHRYHHGRSLVHRSKEGIDILDRSLLPASVSVVAFRSYPMISINHIRRRDVRLFSFLLLFCYSEMLSRRFIVACF